MSVRRAFLGTPTPAGWPLPCPSRRIAELATPDAGTLTWLVSSVADDSDTEDWPSLIVRFPDGSHEEAAVSLADLLEPGFPESSLPWSAWRDLLETPAVAVVWDAPPPLVAADLPRHRRRHQSGTLASLAEALGDALAACFRSEVFTAAIAMEAAADLESPLMRPHVGTAVEASIRVYVPPDSFGPLAALQEVAGVEATVAIAGVGLASVPQYPELPPQAEDEHRKPARLVRASEIGAPPLRAEISSFEVRPAFVAASELVEAVALRVGVPALSRGAMRRNMLQLTVAPLVLAADHFEPMPALNAIWCDGLRLVPAGSNVRTSVADIAQGVLAPWDPVDTGLSAAGWHAECRKGLRAALMGARAATGRPPSALLCGKLSQLPHRLATWPALVHYMLLLNERGPLPWRLSRAATRAWHGYEAVDFTTYRRELLAWALTVTDTGLGAPLDEVADRLRAAAARLRDVVGPLLAEVDALGAPEPFMRTVQDPFVALCAVLDGATAGALASPTRAGEALWRAVAALDAVDARDASPLEMPAAQEERDTPQYRGVDDGE